MISFSSDECYINHYQENTPYALSDGDVSKPKTVTSLKAHEFRSTGSCCCHENKREHVIARNVIGDMLQQMQLFANWDANSPV